MQSLHYLTTDDFYIDQGSKGDYVLCNNIKGISLVMFHANPGRCDYCEELMPHFRRLPQIINGTKFCLLNVNQNRGVVEMSKRTKGPIKFVPYIALYVNGRPFLQYDDENTLEKLIEFVQYAMKLIQNKKTFIDKGGKIESDIPAFTIGIPYNVACDEDKGICFLTYDEAYKKGPQGQQQQRQ